MPILSLTARRLLPVILWMGVIFLASTDLGSAAHTGSIVLWGLRLLSGGHLSLGAMEEIHHLIRKGAHLTEYAILGFLLWRAFSTPASGPARPQIRPAALALLIAALYACTDEYHQSFVPSRTSTIYDVAIDTAGALVGLAICLAVASRRARRLNQAAASPAAG